MNKENYNPVPVYNRKLIRSVYRNMAINKFGYRKVNGVMHECFEKVKEVRRGKEI